MEHYPILPFYMTYKEPIAYEKENSVVRDLEYLQQLYPMEIKKYQKTVAEVLNRIDYYGSVIYDEYPDKCILYRVSNEIVERIKNTETGMEDEIPEKWEWIGHAVSILLLDEIYRRRHSNNRGILKF